MSRRGLKNVRRIAQQLFGQDTWELCTRDGTPVPAFAVYCQKNFEYSFRTQKRYAEVTSRFIDYLFEAKTFDAYMVEVHQGLKACLDANVALVSSPTETEVVLGQLLVRLIGGKRGK